MHDETDDILEIFQEYTETFRQKNAFALLPFFGYPALMVDRDEKPKVLSNPMIAAIGFHCLIRQLVKKGFSHSKLHTLEVKQVHDNLAIVSGTATRHDTADKEFDKFGFTYTLRKFPKEFPKKWKIIAGVIHKHEGFLTRSK